jgi:hypothetical protein
MGCSILFTPDLTPGIKRLLLYNFPWVVEHAGLRGIQSISSPARCSEDDTELSGSPELHKPCCNSMIEETLREANGGKSPWQQTMRNLVGATGRPNFFQLAAFTVPSQKTSLEHWVLSIEQGVLDGIQGRLR